MNVVYDQKEIESLQPIMDIIKTYDNPDTKLDGPIKWASIIQFINYLTFQSNHIYKNALDVGCGLSNLPNMVLDQGFNVTAIDKYGIRNSVLNNKQINTFIVDAFNFLEMGPDDKWDVIYDSCAVVHFDPDLPDPHCYNGGCAMLAEIIKRKLHPQGYFITVTDFALENSNNEFMLLDQLIDCYELVGLKLVGDRPKIPENPFYIDYDKYKLGIVRLLFQK